MKLSDVFIITSNIDSVTVYYSAHESVSVHEDGGIDMLAKYAVFSPYMDSPVATVVVYSQDMSIYLEDTSSASDDHEDEMPELSDIRECINEFFDYAESCGVGALL